MSNLINRNELISALMKECPDDGSGWQSGMERAIEIVTKFYETEVDIAAIEYPECANAMLRMWMDGILTDRQYDRIMDKLNAYWRCRRGK